MSPGEAAVLETFVVPRYLSLFGDLALKMLGEDRGAKVVHLHSRTGHPHQGITRKLPGSQISGCELSTHAIELARAKAATNPDMVADYRAWDGGAVPLAAGAFTHGLSIHPLASSEKRSFLLDELTRLLAKRGQLLFAMPLRGSFQELGDLLHEWALKHEAPAISKAVQDAAENRPSPEMLSHELVSRHFDDVEVEVTPAVLRFQSGRDFFEDPVTRLVLLPEACIDLPMGDLEEPLRYVRDAMDKYWSDGTFELTVNVGCVSGRKA
ncbi:MAG: class I SAM-dependent methyltransferase [Polyangiaceae bacterium]